MLNRLRCSRAGYWVVALYALAMVTLGFAHQPLALPGKSVELAAYALPDGSLPIICGQDGPTPQSVVFRHCDACAISHAPGLVPPHQVGLTAPRSRTIAAWIDPFGQFTPLARHAPTSRGPPDHVALIA